MERVSTIFIPTKSAIEGSLKFCSFNILGVAELNEIGKPNISNYRRIAYVAEPVKPSESDVATATILRQRQPSKSNRTKPLFWLVLLWLRQSTPPPRKSRRSDRLLPKSHQTQPQHPRLWSLEGRSLNQTRKTVKSDRLLPSSPQTNPKCGSMPPRFRVCPVEKRRTKWSDRFLEKIHRTYIMSV